MKRGVDGGGGAGDKRPFAAGLALGFRQRCCSLLGLLVDQNQDSHSRGWDLELLLLLLL